MNSFHFARFAALLCLVGTLSPALCRPALSQTQGGATSAGTVKVGGDVIKPGSWTLAQIQKLAPVQTVKTTLKGKPYTVKGIPLRALVEAAGPRFPTATKHPEARFVVLASGKDGYTVAFSWPELMPAGSSKDALVIWEANGAPLPPDDGPLRVVVPGEGKPMRWVYSLVSLRLYDGARYDK